MIIRILHDGKCDLCRSRDQFNDNITDINTFNARSLLLEGLNEDDLWKRIYVLGFSGVQHITVFIDGVIETYSRPYPIKPI